MWCLHPRCFVVPFLYVVLFSFLDSPAWASFSVQVSAHKTHENAQRYINTLNDKELDLWIFEASGDSGFSYKVVFGQFQNQSLAREASMSLREKFPGAFSIKTSSNALTQVDWNRLKFESSKSEISSTKSKSLNQSVQEKNGLEDEIDIEKPKDKSLFSKSIKKMTTNELLAVGEWAESNSVGVPALEHFLSQKSKHPQINQARLRLARRLLGRGDFERVRELLKQVHNEGSRDVILRADYILAYTELYENGSSEAFNSFVQVATNRFQPMDIRVDAMRRAAGAAHSAGDYNSAHAAYDKLKNFAPTDQQRAEAAIQIAGLHFELKARFGKGTWDFVRLSCHEACGMNGVSRQDEATGALMYAETYYMESNWPTAEKKLTRVIEEFSEIKREKASALALRGIVRFRMRKYDEAERDFRGVFSKELSSVDTFSGTDPRAKAAAWLAHLCARSGDYEGEKEFLSILERDYSNTKEYTETRRIYGDRFEQIVLKK